MAIRFRLRRGTAAAWTAANPVLGDGEVGHETDTGFEKVGDGATAWVALAYRTRRTTDDLPEGASNQYFAAARVLATVLTGIDLATDAAVTAADTVLSALGKLWAKLTAYISDIANAADQAKGSALVGHRGTTVGATLGAMVLVGLSTTNSSGAAAANLTAIQASLTAGGLVYIVTPGVFYINGQLVLGSNTTLRLGPGVELKQYAGSNGRMLTTATFMQAPISVVLAWSAGTSVTVTWPAHGKSIGDYVLIDNSATVTMLQSRFKGVWRVTSVIDANNFTYDTILLPTQAPSGTWTAKNATVDSTVEGGTWNYNAANNGGGANITTHCMLMVGMANCHIRPRRFYDLLKFGVCVNGDSGSVVDAIECDSINSTGGDVVKVYGPAFGTLVRDTKGRTADDMVSVQTKEPAAYFAYMAMYGDCIGVKVQDTYGSKNTNNTAGVVFYASPNETFKGGRIDGVHGVFAGHCVRLQSAGEMGAVLFDASVARVTANGSNSVFVSGGVGTLSAGTITVEDSSHNPNLLTGNFMTIASTATVEVFNNIGNRTEIDSLAAPSWPTGSAAVFLDVAGTVNLVNSVGCHMNGTANARFLQLDAGASVRQANIRDCRLLGDHGVVIQASQGAIPHIVYSGCDLSLTDAVTTAASANVVAIANTLNAATIIAKQTAGTVTLTHGGNVLLGTSSLTTGTVAVTAW